MHASSRQSQAAGSSSASVASSSHYYARSTSPLPPPAATAGGMSATSKSHRYLRRLLKFDQMDFEFALWQMLYLFVAPQKVYRNFNYRKQTKSQFARDDPAFLVLLMVCLCVTSIGFAWTLDLGIGQSVYFLFYVVVVDFLLCGVATATLMWTLTNRYLRGSPQLDADIEWGYSFDVHLNAFFPPLILLHFVQLFFYHGLINHDRFAARFFGNTIWLLALCYYIYITFLGYNCISFLRNTRLILAPLTLTVLLYIITLIIGWNVTQTFMNFYHYRVL